MEDQVLTCKTCGKKFAFTASEHEFYNSKGFTLPSHCHECRAQRKRDRDRAAEGTVEIVMVKQINTGGRIWSEVVCADCGKPTQVPFKPTGEKPVYCRDCLDARRKPQRSSETLPAQPTARAEKQGDAGNAPPSAMSQTPESAWVDDPGPLPDFDPAPDEEGEITTADFIPFPMNFGSTPEETNPKFNDDAADSKDAKP